MGNLTLSGATSGQITVTPTAVAGTNTLTLPAITGTIGISGPAFSVGCNGTQTISNTTLTKVTFATEPFDTNNNFASNTFTPTVAGYYQINASCSVGAGTSITNCTTAIYKNGSSWSQVYGAAYTSTTAASAIADVVYCNGTTDYIELYVRANGSGTLTVLAVTFMSGCFLRST
jgi:hypothetical protein